MIKYKIDIFLWKKMFQLNRVYVIFDQPTAVSMIKIWNYSKTANRGAKDIAVSLKQAQSTLSLSLFTIPESDARNSLKIIKCPIYKHKYISLEKKTSYRGKEFKYFMKISKILLTFISEKI